MKNLKIFLPDINVQELVGLGVFNFDDSDIVIEQLTKNWQVIFCEFIGYKDKNLPWTQLRAAQFDLPKTVKVACRCDPVLMQMTHRGAYMLGQAPLNISHNDAIRIVAQINERLMGDDECLYLCDKNAWLYTSNKNRVLDFFPIEDLVGKDIFNYPYQGNDSEFWHQISTEIQMLIKEMIDYQGLPASAPETIINVHFSDCIELDNMPEIPFIKKQEIIVCSKNELIKNFCMKSLLAYQTTENLKVIKKENAAILAFESEQDCYASIFQFWNTMKKDTSIKTCEMICQDANIVLKVSGGWFKQLCNSFSKKAI